MGLSMNMRRFTYHALVALITFIVGVALTTLWKHARKVDIPSAISHDVPRVLLSCPQGQCQAICSDKHAGVPTIKPEVQSEAPLEILLEPPATNSSVRATAIGNLVLRNRNTKPIRGYGLTYQVSGSAWSNTFFALYGFALSFPEPTDSFIKPREKRPVETAQIQVPANAEVRLRLYFAIFEDGTTWQDRR